MNSPTICTIIAKNYLAQARCLTESFLAFHPEGKVFVLLVDEVSGKFVPEKEKFTTVQLKDLTIPKLPEMRERYGVAELCTAVKPYFLEYLFEKQGLKRVCYFDPDIYFYGPIDRVWNELEKSAIILTPHILGPLDERQRPNEFTVFQAGVFNLGFLGLRRGQESSQLLPWWQERLIAHSHNAPEKNEHYDQKWMDLIPGFFDRVLIDREAGLNVAYWDLSNRTVTPSEGKYLVNGQPLTFFHFSGYDPRRPDVISKYQDRFTFATLPQLRKLFDDYRQRLLANGFHDTAVSTPLAPRVRVPLLAPWLYRSVTSGLAAAGLEKPLTRLLGRRAIGRLQRVFLQPGKTPLPARGQKLESGIHVLSFFEHAGGVGEVARRSVRALAEGGVLFRWTTLEAAGSFSAVEERLPQQQPGTLAVNMWHVNADILPGVMAQQRSLAENGAANVAYWAWELPEFPAEWQNRAALLDEIWVGSSFVQQAVSQHISLPIHVMGAPIETGKVDGGIRKRLGLPEDRFLFLFTFDLASYIERKNPSAIMAAYQRACGGNFSQTILVMKVLNAHKHPEERQHLRDELARVNGRLIEDVLTREDMQSLTASCDAYVSLHRSEGFGVTMAEAMAYGKPVIATHYSGNSDYMTQENSYPVPFRLIHLAQDVGPYRAGSTWAEPDIAAAAQAMRSVMNSPEEARARGERAAREIRERYELAAFAKRMQARLQVLCSDSFSLDREKVKDEGFLKTTLTQPSPYTGRGVNKNPWKHMSGS